MIIQKPLIQVRRKWPLCFYGHMESALGQWDSVTTSGGGATSYDTADGAHWGATNFKVTASAAANDTAFGKLATNYSKLRISFWLKLHADLTLGTGDYVFLSLPDGGDQRPTIRLHEVGGNIKLCVQGQGTDSPETTITKDVWHFLEIEWIASPSSGICRVWLNGVSKLWVTDGTEDAPATTFNLGFVFSVAADTIGTIYFDDVRIYGQT